MTVAGLSLALLGCSPPQSSVPHPEAVAPVRSPLAITPALVSLANAAPRTLDPADRENLVGAAVYRATCALCHGPGIAGAPKLDHHESWRHRIASGRDTLVRHAIAGYRGDRGLMPPKGGNRAISDAELYDIVAWIRTLD